MKTKILCFIFTVFLFVGCTNSVGKNEPVVQDELEEIPVIETNTDVKITEIPFDQAIKGILESKSQELAKGIKVEIMDGYKIIGIANGDLNSDSNADIAVVVEQAPGKYLGSRAIYILIQNKENNYFVKHLNQYTVFGAEEGGVLGDPFQNIEIQNGALSINEYGGSNFRWASKDQFQYVKNELMLIGSQRIQFYTGTENGIQVNFDYSNKTIKYTSYSANNQNQNPVLIFELQTKKQKYLFDEFNINSYENANDVKYLPSLGWYEYGKYNQIRETKISANKALDLVKDTYYKKMKKVKIPWTEQTKANYSNLAAYQVADYYYQTDKTILYYFYLSDGSNGNLEHFILSIDENEVSQFYKVNDETGELTKQ